MNTYINVINIYKYNKYYPNSELTPEASKILKLLPPRPILTPVLVGLYETNIFYIEWCRDNTGSDFILQGITVIDKNGNRIRDREIGGFISNTEIEFHINELGKL